MTIGWVTAFVDVPGPRHRAAVDFWCAVSGATESPARGADAQFSTALPPDGEAYLRFQRLDADRARIHLDLHVADPDAADEAARDLGAVDVPGSAGIRIQRSPGGFVYCFVPSAGSARRPAPQHWTGDSGSSWSTQLDQVSLDIPPRLYEDEVAFWSRLTGWAFTRSRENAEFAFLTGPRPLPVRLLLQRLDDDAPAVTAHLDLACSDVAAEVRRQLELGAERSHPGRGWETLRDPAGLEYCVTGRVPIG